MPEHDRLPARPGAPPHVPASGSLAATSVHLQVGLLPLRVTADRGRAADHDDDFVVVRVHTSASTSPGAERRGTALTISGPRLAVMALGGQIAEAAEAVLPAQPEGGA
jgi:hypothetical protein